MEKKLAYIAHVFFTDQKTPGFLLSSMDGTFNRENCIKNAQEFLSTNQLYSAVLHTIVIDKGETIPRDETIYDAEKAFYAAYENPPAVEAQCP